MKKETVCYIACLCLVGISGGVLASTGYGLTTWQWWVVTLALVASHILGREIGDQGDR